MESLLSDDAVAQTKQSHSHTQPAPSQALVMDDDIKRMLEICTNLSPKNRSKMLSICEDLLIDAGFDRVGYYISRYVPPIRQFRFMGLPLELRSIVARYALTANKLLCFKWLQYTPKEKISTLHGLDQLTALTRVSKNLREETIDLVWRLNDFCFPASVTLGWHIDPSLRKPGIEAIEEAIRVFFHRLSNTSLSQISIQLECSTLDGLTRFLTQIDDLVNSYSLLEPRAEWKVVDNSWPFDCRGSGFATTYTTFVEKAQTLELVLANFDATIQLRRWRVFSDTYPGPEKAVQHLIAAGLPDAQVWFEDGL